MSNFRRALPTDGGVRNNVLSSLRATQMVESKPVLPAEIISTILDYLPIHDLMSFARTSKRMLEMVYEDSRWVQRLQAMGVWNEGEARKRFEDALNRKKELMKTRIGEISKRTGIGVTGSFDMQRSSTTLFDAESEERQGKRSAELTKATAQKFADGFDALSLRSISPQVLVSRQRMLDAESLLHVFAEIRSIRGSARIEYAKIYAALAPFYNDLVRSKSHMDPVIFRVFRDPEQQAKMLADLQIFARSDWAQGWRLREEKLYTMVAIFENAVLREFEQGYEIWDIDGRMHRYAHVLAVLNGGHACTDLFVQKHPLLSDGDILGNPLDCIDKASAETISLEASRQFLANLLVQVNLQVDIIDRVFPVGEDVLQRFLERIGDDILLEYVTPLFDEAHERSIVSYLKAVSGIFEQMLHFATSIKPTKNSGADFAEKVTSIVAKVFEPHVDLYLQEELDFFKGWAQKEVDTWENELSVQDANNESFFMANFNRQADKKDFISSFKKVVMLPVTVLPSLPISSPFTAPRPTMISNKASLQAPNHTHSSSFARLQTPGNSVEERSTTPLPIVAPTDELSAKAALMASRLEGIRSLFSLEVALDLTHAAKVSLGRAALFINLGGHTGEEAREQCEAIFVFLLQTLGNQHVKVGFDKAVEHLSKYNPREVVEHQQAVAPLVTFLELVNIGDLISQMIDVFYEQQLAASNIADRNDFLNSATKAKKKFEQMLDERVAAGLNKGIDVLMDEVEFICSMNQLPTDYNPIPALDGFLHDFDISPTKAAEKVVSLVESHTRMLAGSTDKTMLDVFNQEVGLRLFTALCKHLKRQRVSVDGATKLISDMNLYFVYIRSLRNQDLLEYFTALRELSQIYLIDPKHAKEMADIIADGGRFHGIFRAEEVYEFAERRADWYTVKKDVEKAMYGIGCVIT